MIDQQEVGTELRYRPLPTLRQFHACSAAHRAIIGTVGSGKTSGVTMEVGWYLPRDLCRWYGMQLIRGCVVRNTYTELMDTTLKTVLEWYPAGHWKESRRTFHLGHRCEIDGQEVDLEIEMLFRSCDRKEDVKKFKSLELTWFWVDESCEVSEEIKLMLKNRIGRFPKYRDRKSGEIRPCPVKYGIETSNPPTIDQPLYSNYAWVTPPPGPRPEKPPLPGHVGFWQPARENEPNLRPGYYDDLRGDYRDHPDWLTVYIEGKPGVIIKGKLVINNFRQAIHVAQESLRWSGGVLYRGWDNTGNCPAAVVVQVPSAGREQVLAEFHTQRMGIIDFTRMVVESCNREFPGAAYVDYGDPAGQSQFSRSGGGLTSNAELMESVGVKVIPSEQNFTARVEAVEQQLGRIEGMLIDPSCNMLINGFLGGYCYPELGTSGIYAETPDKNKYSHPHDALQYVTVALFGNRRAKKPSGSSGSSGSSRVVPAGVPAGSAWMGR